MLLTLVFFEFNSAKWAVFREDSSHSRRKKCRNISLWCYRISGSSNLILRSCLPEQSSMIESAADTILRRGETPHTDCV